MTLRICIKNFRGVQCTDVVLSNATVADEKARRHAEDDSQPLKTNRPTLCGAALQREMGSIFSLQAGPKLLNRRDGIVLETYDLSTFVIAGACFYTIPSSKSTRSNDITARSPTESCGSNCCVRTDPCQQRLSSFDLTYSYFFSTVWLRRSQAVKM